MPTLVLDAHGVTTLDADRREALVEAGLWPPVIAATTVAESTTGDPRRDHRANRVVKQSAVVDVTEPIARRAGALRFAARKGGVPDAVVVAVAEQGALKGVVIYTSDADDIGALVDVSPLRGRMTVVPTSPARRGRRST